MLKIGVTGGIGSGKSIVCQVLESLGYPVFYSDAEAKYITLSDPEVRSGLIERYGEQVYIEGQVDREFLSEQIFQDAGEREYVNSLIHPKVQEAFDSFAEQSKGDFIFNEAAIIFETGSYVRFDKTILITAPKSLRIERVMKRDSCSLESVRERMASQWSDEKKIPLADAVIANDDKNPLLTQIEKVLVDFR